MKYRYKQTGIIVESGDLLDSAVYIPITEEEPESIEEEAVSKECTSKRHGRMKKKVRSRQTQNRRKRSRRLKRRHQGNGP